FTAYFMSLTHGYGIQHHTSDQYAPYINEQIGGRRNGALVSTDTGKATTYGIMQVEDRGTIFVNPGTQVYGGMIVGESTREKDIVVNIIRSKNLTNVRSSNKDQTASIKAPKLLTLEESLEFKIGRATCRES